MKIIKRTSIIISIVLFSCSANAQPAGFTAVGAQGFEKATNIKSLSDGGFVVVGETESYGLKERDMLLHRFDANGNLQWTKTYGGPEREVINDILQLNNGNFVFAAEKYQPDKKEGEALTIVKTDPSGKMIWKKVIDEGGQETEGFSLKLLKDGFAVAGMVKTMSVISDAFFNMRSEEQFLYLLKTDLNGKKKWSKKFVSTAANVSSTGSDMLVDENKNFVMAGNITLKGKTDKKIERPATDINYYDSRRGLLLAADEMGKLLWVKSYEIGGITMSYVVKQSTSGNLLIAGNTLLGLSNMDVFLMETDRSGNVLWAKTYGTNAFESLADVVQANDGGWMATAITNVIDGNFEDALLFKTDSKGELQWSVAYGDKNEDLPARIIKHNNGYLLAGSTGGYGSRSFDVMLLNVDEAGRSCIAPKEVKLNVRVAKVKTGEVSGAKLVDVEQGVSAPNLPRPSPENIEEKLRMPEVRNLCK